MTEQEMADKENSISLANKKRQRTENWLEEDKKLLKELVRERVREIENKSTDTNTNKRKKNAWIAVQNSFNTLCTGMHRTVAQLKSQWAIIKIITKKKKAEEKRGITKTGGGPPPHPPSSDGGNADDISVWLPQEFETDTNEFDCDYTAAESQSNSLPEKIKHDVLEESQTFGQITQIPQPLIAEIIINDHDVENVHPLEISNINNANITTGNLQANSKRDKIPKKKKKTGLVQSTSTSVTQIVELENKCRLELHEIQIENERKRGRNLDLKYELMLAKLSYFKNKNTE